MRKLNGVIVGLALLATVTSARAEQSTVQKVSSQSVAVIWRNIGDFCGIASWQPGVVKCELSKDRKRRTLTLKNGSKAVEELLHWSNRRHLYTYRFVSGALPVTHYESTIQVAPNKGGKGSVITWRGHYDAKGVSDAKAKEIIDGIYESGVAALARG